MMNTHADKHPAKRAIEPQTLLNSSILSYDDLRFLKISPRGYVLSPIIRKQTINQIHAGRGYGKSLFRDAIARAMASKSKIGPWSAPQVSSVIIFDGEMLVEDTQERNAMFPPIDGLQITYIINDHLQERGVERINLTNPECREWIKKIILETRSDVAIFDNTSCLCPGIDENGKLDFDPIVEFFLDLKFAGITVFFISHDGKAGKMRGHSGREDVIDCSIQLIRPRDYKPTDGARFIVHFDKARIPQSDLHAIADVEFKLVRNGDYYEWDWERPSVDKKRECLRLLAEGMEQSVISCLVEVSPGTISKWKSKFIEKRYLTSDGKLTESGESYAGVYEQ